MKFLELKQEAIKLLSNCWAEACIVSIILMSFVAIFLSAGYFIYAVLIYLGEASGSYKDVIFSGNVYYIAGLIFRFIVCYIFMSPVLSGKSYCFLQAVKGQIVPINCIFSCYASRGIFVKSLKIRILTDLRRAVVLIPVLLGVVFEIDMLLHIFKNNIWGKMEVFSAVGCIVIIVSLIILYTLYSSRYTAVPYIFVSNPDVNSDKIIKQSLEYVKENNFRLLKLKLSFLGWLVLCILIFPLILVLPYYCMTLALAVNNIITEPQKKDNDNDMDTEEMSVVSG